MTAPDPLDPAAVEAAAEALYGNADALAMTHARRAITAYLDRSGLAEARASLERVERDLPQPPLPGSRGRAAAHRQRARQSLPASGEPVMACDSLDLFSVVVILGFFACCFGIVWVTFR